MSGEQYNSVRDMLVGIGADPELIKGVDDNVNFRNASQAVRAAAVPMLLDFFGERCADFNPDCVCCKRWKLLDDLTESPFE